MRVDKEKWEKRTLGEVGQIISGATPRTNEPLNWEGGTYNWVTPAELKGNKLYGSTNKKITDYALMHTKLTLMPVGTVLLSSRAPIGKVAITTEPMYCNQGFKNIVCNEEFVHNEYVYYYLLYSNDELNRRGNGVTFKEISKKVVESFPIIVPPLYIQHSIARELDSVQAMIDGYRQQIADLDALAQSIFLDTFGDPVSNPKGWETNSFGNLFSLKSGDGLSAKNFEEGEYPVYGGNGITGYHNSFNKDGEFIIIGRVGAYCGNVRLVRGRFWLTDNAFELKQTNIKFESRFLTMLLDMLNLGNKAKAMAQPVISNVSLKHVSVILPPLHLQHHFAAQIESIENQKALLRQQLEDAETLMAERMQYYFA